MISDELKYSHYLNKSAMTMTLNFLTIHFYKSYKRLSQAKNNAITYKDYKYNINVPKDTLT